MQQMYVDHQCDARIEEDTLSGLWRCETSANGETVTHLCTANLSTDRQMLTILIREGVMVLWRRQTLQEAWGWMTGS